MIFNVIIQDAIITKDYNKIIKAAFFHFNENFHPKIILQEIIEFTELYFCCLELYSNQRNLKIKVKKKKRVKKNDEDEEQLVENYKKEKNFIENDGQNDNKSEHTGSVDLSEDDKDQYIERDLSVNEETKTIIVDYAVISKIMILLKKDKFLENSNNSKSNYIYRIITKLFERIVNKIDSGWIFYQLEYLNIFNFLLNNKDFDTNLVYHDLKAVIEKVVKSYFDLLKTNKLLIIESLFRFQNSIIRDDIFNNYEAIVVDEKDDNRDFDNNEFEKDLEYDGIMEFEKDPDAELALNNLKKKKKNNYNKEQNENMKKLLNDDREDEDMEEKWTESDDIILIENYKEFSEFTNFYEILEKLFPFKTKSDLRHRIKDLKLKKGLERAYKQVKRLHAPKEVSKPVKDNQNQLFNLIIDLSDECKKPEKKIKIEKTILSLKQQLESYKIQKELEYTRQKQLKEQEKLLVDKEHKEHKEEHKGEIECILIPTSEEEHDVMLDDKFQLFIKTLGFVPPSSNDDNIDLENVQELEYTNVNSVEKLFPVKKSSSNYWSLDSNKNCLDIEILIEKLDNFEKIINDNIEEYNEDREKEREKVVSKKKLKNKSKKHKHKHKSKYSDEDDDVDDDLDEIMKEYKEEEGKDVEGEGNNFDEDGENKEDRETRRKHKKEKKEKHKHKHKHKDKKDKKDKKHKKDKMKSRLEALQESDNESKNSNSNRSNKKENDNNEGDENNNDAINDDDNNDNNSAKSAQNENEYIPGGGFFNANNNASTKMEIDDDLQKETINDANIGN